MKYNLLNTREKNVIENKDTEPPFSGEYDNFFQEGTFICRRCNTPLFSAEAKFDAGCGWPSFDENYSQAVTESKDQDGFRTEITCTHCGAHLGHVFKGEMMTEKNTRHCVNSLSIRFIPIKQKLPEVLDGK
jgi:peptide-methionine (R)-S-oxide reductase